MKGLIKIGKTKIEFLPKGKDSLIEIVDAECKTEKVFVPPYSEALITTYHIGDKQIQNDQACKAKIVDKKAIITHLLLGAIPSHKVRERWVEINWLWKKKKLKSN